MFFSRVQVLFITILSLMVLPVVFFTGMLLWGTGSLLDAVASIIFIGNIVFILYKAGYWEFTWYYARYLILLIYVGLSLYIVTGINAGKQIISNGRTGIDITLFLLSLILLYMNINIVRASIKPKNRLLLAFPFRNGKYLITDGGDGKVSHLLNYHNKSQVHKKGQSNNSMRYATDIVKLSRHGFTLKNILKADNSQYEIFHEKVYSPCDATVIDVADGIDNNTPFCGNMPYNVGNCVVLRRENYYIVMGHFQKGSILVKAGDNIKTGQQIAMVGNSGLTPRPHIHMQVSKCDDGILWSGEGIPIVFNKEFPVKNKVISVN